MLELFIMPIKYFVNFWTLVRSTFPALILSLNRVKVFIVQVDVIFVALIILVDNLSPGLLKLE